MKKMMILFVLVTSSIFGYIKMPTESVRDMIEQSSIEEDMLIKWRGEYIGNLLVEMNDEDEELLFSQSFPLLKTLTFENVFLKKMLITPSFAPNLVSLTINYSLGSESDPRTVTNFPNLKKLHLRNSATRTFAQISSSIALDSLEELILNNSKSTFDLTFAPNLKILHILNNDTRNFLSFSQPLLNLELLTIHSPYYSLTSEKLNELATFIPNVKELNLNKSILASSDFQSFSSLENLSLAHTEWALYWNNEPITPNMFDFNKLSLASGLKTLDLSYIDLGNQHLEQMLYVSFPNLTTLSMSSTNVRNISWDTFAPLLEKLDLNQSKVSGKDISNISKMHFLQSLNLSGTKITGGSIKQLEALSTLKNLNLKSTDMSKADFSSLPSSLEILNLEGANLTIASFDTLSHLTHLKELNIKSLTNSNITRNMMNELQVKLKDTKILR